ncbi:tail fiber protein [uncultured Pelagimonas sp.]|uniref:phage tail protein n=1 Tax=uncultured Pelagimonas sp. TaxID=1618102 RepID=UPI00260BFBCC|nr:tail fiber protein [uncultured Pelagimonas sp.]
MIKLTKLAFVSALALGLGNSFTATPAAAGSDPFIGELMAVGYNFCPRGFAEADGTLLAISQYSALFSLYGTQFGGDGRTTFGLPDLRSRSIVHTGNGPGLGDPGPIGTKGGSTNFTITQNQIPPHTHTLRGNEEDADTEEPSGAVPSLAASSIYSSGTADVDMGSSAIMATGGGQAVTKRSPYQVLRWCVALQGIFPSRN